MKRIDAGTAGGLLADMPEWTYSPERGGVILRDFVFADFVQAFGFMTQVALLAEKRNHHPEWCNVYHRVSVTLTTHDAQGLSMYDLELARLMDIAYMPFAASSGQPDPGVPSC